MNIVQNVEEIFLDLEKTFFLVSQYNKHKNGINFLLLVIINIRLINQIGCLFSMDNISFFTLEQTIRSYMRKYNTPGLAISILKDNEVIYSKGFGSRDLQEFKPMDADTLIGIGSITKSFTAFAILKLEEMGKLSIQDSASKYLPVKPFIDHPDIKIFHLLSHSSGVPAADGSITSFTYTFGDFSRVYPTTSKDDFLAHVGEPEDYIIFKPGEAYFYNNDMYACLAFIIEQLSGLTYTEFVKKEIFEPLEMTRAVLSKKDLLNDPNHLTGYRPIKEGEKTVMKNFDVPIGGFIEAAGGIYVSMNEMMHYAQCLLNKGVYKGKKILQPETIEKLWKPIIDRPNGYTKNSKYCLGLAVETDYFENYTFIHHGGGMDTSCAFFGFIPEANIAVSCAQNSCTGPVSVYPRVAISILLGIDFESKITFLRNSKLLEEVSGKYRSSVNMYDFTIGLKKGAIFIDYEIDDGKFSFPVIIHDIDKLQFKICSGLAESENFVTFFRNKETNKVEFVNYDRYLYKKI